jgi:hypothetical protein
MVEDQILSGSAGDQAVVVGVVATAKEYHPWPTIQAFERE